MAKKLVFLAVIIVVCATTVYLVGSTVYQNVASETKGPIHWHADYEVWICDQELHLPSPKGMSNKQGSDLFHSHEDNRVHAEGVLMKKSQASLGAFFSEIGGSLTEDSIGMPTDSGIVSKHDGDSCNGQPGKLHVFVNGNLIEHADDYVISPYENVPPGDRIKIIFTEKSLDQINPNIK